MQHKGRTNQGIDSAVRSLEDAFFVQQDKLLLDRQRQLKQMAETKEALAQASGIKGDELLQRLVDLGIRPETVAALAVVPLVEVAWADGDVTEAERAAVMKAAESSGIVPGGVEHGLLIRWLQRKPGPELLEAWTQYVYALCSRLSAPERLDLRHQLLGQTRAVAEASGGILGIGKISSEEKEAIQKMDESFRCE